MLINKVFDAVTIALSANASSSVLDLPYDIDESFSLQIELTGDGTAKFEYAISNDGETYITKTAGTDPIATGFTKGSGPGTDGKDIISFTPEATKKMKIICTETGAANSVTVTATVLIR